MACSIVVIAAIAACGGSSFTSGGASSDGGGTKSDGGSTAGGEAGSDGGSTGSSGTYCGPALVCTGTGMQQGTICCVTGGNPPSYACAGAECGCATQLGCSSDSECGIGAHCCIDNRKDAACAGGHWVARCQQVCLGAQLCDPKGAATQCLPAQSCSLDTSNVGLPSGAGFGVCN